MNNYIDIHSHILPQIDDGAKDMSQSMEMLQIVKKEGISSIIVTPHYKSGRFRADPELIGKKLVQLQREADEKGLNIKLYPGTEIYYRSDLEEKLDQRMIHTMNGTDYILVEFSPLEDYIYLRNAVNDIFSMGYRPILAHVERYQCMLRDIQKVQELKAMGCSIQVNAGSIAGAVGFKVKRYTHALLKRELVDYIGTDAHNSKERCPAMRKCADIIYRKCDREYADSILFGNARKYLMCGQAE